MTAERRMRANCLNAKKSTGPKTAEGKRRAASNALRHGLSLPVTVNPELSEAVACLARMIAGEGASTSRLEAAWRIAEPQIDLMRLRRARLLLLNNPVVSINQPTVGERLRAAAALLDRLRDINSAAHFQDIQDRESVESVPELELGLDFLAPKLMRRESARRS